MRIYLVEFENLIAKLEIKWVHYIQQQMNEYHLVYYQEYRQVNYFWTNRLSYIFYRCPYIFIYLLYYNVLLHTFNILRYVPTAFICVLFSLHFASIASLFLVVKKWIIEYASIAPTYRKNRVIFSMCGQPHFLRTASILLILWFYGNKSYFVCR